MLSMANRRGRTDKPKPKGAVVNMTTDERRAFKEKREKLGFTHRALAAKAHTSGGTISNIETGESGQVNAAVYARVYAVLFGAKSAVDNQAKLKKLVEDLAEIPDSWGAIGELIASAKKLSKPTGES